MAKVIIAGGRDFVATKEDFDLIEKIEVDNGGFSEIVSGCCRGGDMVGEGYAKDMHIPIKRFPADWKKYGWVAGPIRNQEMAKYADAVILFPGGKGTANMKKMAIRYGLKILHDAETKND